MICRWLDEVGRRSVVVDRARGRVELLESDQLGQDVPGVEADARHPGVLGLAGLGNRHCEGVLALTDNDQVNLAIVMAVNLLRPDLPVIARCCDRTVQARMAEFAPAAIVNPHDRYGAYLVLALRQPVTYQLVSWLMSPVGTPLPPLRDGVAQGRWAVCADGQFATEVVRDLREAGFEVVTLDPAAGSPDLSGVAGFVAGTADDTANLALAAHARLDNPDIYLAVRQTSHLNAPLLAAFDLDSVFVATELLARECFARIITPVFWAFLDHALHEPDAWSAGVRDTLIDAVGHRRPDSTRVRLDAVHAPAVARWLARRQLVIGDLLRHPDDRDTTVAAAVVALIRRAPAETEPAPEPQIVFAPDPATPLRTGDELVVLGRESGFRELSDTLFQDSAVEYVATGRQVPTTWLWRVLSRRRRGALEKT